MEDALWQQNGEQQYQTMWRKDLCDQSAPPYDDVTMVMEMEMETKFEYDKI